MVEILRKAEKTSVAAVAKENKLSELTIYLMRQHFVGLEPNDVNLTKALHAESVKLEGLLAGRDLKIGAMKEGVRQKSRACTLVANLLGCPSSRGILRRRA